MNWRKLLLPLNGPYYFATWLRNKLFDLGILKSSGFEVPTLVVGNLSTGGTGKTPHTEWILESDLAKQPVVLSRGYGRKTKGFLWVETTHSAYEVGDEPLQIKRKFLSIPVAVCEDRVMAIAQIMADYPDTGLVVLDDAYQHRYLRASLAMLITQFNYPYFNDVVLPAGNLREPRSGAKRAKIVVVSKCPKELSPESMDMFRSKLKLDSDQSLYFSQQLIAAPKFLEGTPVEEDFFHRQAFVFSAIAGGDEWASEVLLKFAGKKGSLTYRDHHRFSRFDIQLLLKKTTEQDVILTTEKDAMRLEPFQEMLQKRTVVYFPLRLTFFGKEEVLKQDLISGLKL